MDGAEHLDQQRPKPSTRWRSNCPRITPMDANDFQANVRGARRSTASTRRVSNTPWLKINRSLFAGISVTYPSYSRSFA